MSLWKFYRAPPPKVDAPYGNILLLTTAYNRYVGVNFLGDIITAHTETSLM